MTSARALTALLLLGLAGLGLSFGLSSPARFWTNVLLVFLLTLTTGLGALFLVALEHLVGARWSVPLRRTAERIASLTMLAAPLALLSLLSLPVLYPWTRADAALHPLVAGKAIWLNVPFFTLRVLLCIALWALAHRILVVGSRRQDAAIDDAFNRRARRFAPGFMAIFAATITLVAFDWISSLEPEWYSDIFGVYLFAGTFMAGLAATSLLAVHLIERGHLSKVGFSHLYNLGGFLFAFTVFWSYIGFAQYMLMWYANIPEEVVWYQKRLQGPWLVLMLAIALLHFIIPFFALIPRDAKGDPRRLRWVALMILIAHALDLYWLVAPAHLPHPAFSWPEASALAALVGIVGLWIGRTLKRGADMPIGDPHLAEGLELQL
jgi:hypothetical protein